MGRQAIGKAGERAAEAFLSNQGYEILTRNYRKACGEIDLIACHGDTIVFVEVKAGRVGKFGPPEERVDDRKRRQIGRIAALYLQETGQEDRPCRFDVIAITEKGGHPVVRHWIDAFWIEEAWDDA